MSAARATLHARIPLCRPAIQIQPDPPPPPSPSKRHWQHRLTPQIAARYLQPVSWAVGLMVLAHPNHHPRAPCPRRVCGSDFDAAVLPVVLFGQKRRQVLVALLLGTSAAVLGVGLARVAIWWWRWMVVQAASPPPIASATRCSSRPIAC